ncbi:MAG: (4Fe-4S)-binding protein [Crocinitomicaceae bacterium]|nr:(4Fe-4S)-binding protein [Crocinitomicaceae bacterium]
MDKAITKEYSNDGVTVVWNSGKCKHAAECVKNAGNVFKPKESPWIQMENGSSEEIMAAIDKCPSGALSYGAKK